MADPYYKGTPYGWAMDYLYSNKYNLISWLEYVEKMEDWLNQRDVNYSIVHYKTMVRVHVYFSALKKMGFKDAVELYWFSTQLKVNPAMYKFGMPWNHDDVEKHVRKYFLKNDLEIKE